MLDDNLRPDPEDFWKILELYDLLPYELSKKTAYEYISFPTIIKGKLNWMTLDEMRSSGLKYIALDDYPNSPHPETIYIPLNNIYSILKKYNYESWGLDKFEESITSVIRVSTKLHLENHEIFYEIDPMSTPFKKVGETLKTEPFNYQYYQIHKNELEEYIYVFNQAKGVNYSHPVLKFILNNTDDSYNNFIFGIENLFSDLVNEIDIYQKESDEWNNDIINKIEHIMYFWNKFDWNILPTEIKPPYKILFPATGVEIEISPEFFEQKLKDLGINEKINSRELVNLD